MDLILDSAITLFAGRIVVTSNKRAHNPSLVASGLTDKPPRLPWLNSELRIQFA
jgi:hypothetical protein